jgi:hypothetical protein
MRIEISDPAGRIPAHTGELIAAYFVTPRLSNAAAAAGITEDEARSVFAIPAVKQINGEIWGAMMEQVVRSGRRLHDSGPANSGTEQEA